MCDSHKAVTQDPHENLMQLSTPVDLTFFGAPDITWCLLHAVQCEAVFTLRRSGVGAHGSMHCCSA